MWFKLAGADFSKNNLGTMSSISSSYLIDYTGLTGMSGSPSSVSYAGSSAGTSKSVSVVVTVTSGYTFKSGSTITASGGKTGTVFTADKDYTGGQTITFTMSVTANTKLTGAAEATGGSSSGGSGGTTTNYTFTINPTPTSATVTLSATGYTTVSGTGSKSITVASGTTVSWSVSASGYTTQSGTQSVTSTSSKNVTLSAGEVGTVIEPIETIAGFYNRSKKLTNHGNYNTFKYDTSIADVINLDFKAAPALVGLWEKADGSMLYAYWGDNSSSRSNFTFLVPEYATAFYASAYVGSNGATKCDLTIGSMENGVILPPISEIDKTYIDATSLENTTTDEACTLFRFNVKDYSNIHLTMTLAENSCAAWVDDSGNRYKIVDGTGVAIDQDFTNADNRPYLEVSPLNTSAATMLVIAQ